MLISPTEKEAEATKTEASNLIVRLLDIFTFVVQSCADYVLAQHEVMLHGMIVQVLHSGHATIFSDKASNCFIEQICLLTQSYLYICSYDIDLEKVTRYSRIRLKNINQVQKGAIFVDRIREENSYGLAIDLGMSDDETRIAGTKFNTRELIKKIYSVGVDKKRDDENKITYIKVVSTSPEMSQSKSICHKITF